MFGDKKRKVKKGDLKMAHTNKTIEPKKSAEQETLPETIMIGAVAVFVFALFVLYPLYFQDK